MRKKVLTVEYDGLTYSAVQWDGSHFPSDYEEFEGIGFFEDDNGYDLESVDTDFILEAGRRKGVVRQDDWVLKNSIGKFGNVSAVFFSEKMKRLSTSEDIKNAFDILDKKFPINKSSEELDKLKSIVGRFVIASNGLSRWVRMDQGIKLPSDLEIQLKDLYQLQCDVETELSNHE